MRRLWAVPIGISALTLAACVPLKPAPPHGSITFSCSPSDDFQHFTIPAGVTSIEIDAFGGAGGNGDGGAPGGLGGRSRATYSVSPGAVLTLGVGCQGAG
ncbi:MAG: hypothetical protein ACRDY4_07380, partial [Acidimicrobiia bacterium]